MMLKILKNRTPLNGLTIKIFCKMSFWAHDKTAQILLQSMQIWYFFQMMHFFWSRLYGIELLGIYLILTCFKIMF